MAKVDQKFSDKAAPAGATEALARDLLFALLPARPGMTPESTAAEAWAMARAFKREAAKDGDGPDTLKLTQGAG